MAQRIPANELSLWEYAKAPAALRRLVQGSPDWLAYIPAARDSWEIELEFLQMLEGTLASRHVCEDGSVLFSGRFSSDSPKLNRVFGPIAQQTDRDSLNQTRHVQPPTPPSRRKRR
jgi:hypothetical protein